MCGLRTSRAMNMTEWVQTWGRQRWILSSVAGGGSNWAWEQEVPAGSPPAPLREASCSYIATWGAALRVPPPPPLSRLGPWQPEPSSPGEWPCSPPGSSPGWPPSCSRSHSQSAEQHEQRMNPAAAASARVLRQYQRVEEKTRCLRRWEEDGEELYGSHSGEIGMMTSAKKTARCKR